MMRGTLLKTVLASTLCAWPALAEPPAPPARCALKSVQALPSPGGIEPTLARLRPYLERPPFTAWHTFKLLGEKEATLTPGATASYPTPTGRSAQVTYTSHATSSDGRHLVRGVLRVAGSRSTSKTSFSLDEGGFFLVAGERYGGGILIYSLSCNVDH